MTRLLGGVLASNIAYDPQGRLSAHGIFNVLQHHGVFVFQHPIYAIVTLLDVTPGAHKVGISVSEHATVVAPTINFEVSNGTALIAIAIQHCELRQAGQYKFFAEVDGNRLDGNIVLTYLLPPEPPPIES